MKKLFFIFCAISLCLNGFSQDLLLGVMPEVNGKVHYQKVVKANLDAKQLLTNAKLFLNDNFGSETIDESNGLIIKKGVITSEGCCEEIPFTLKIQVKDGRYKCEVYDLYVKADAMSFGHITMPERQYPIEASFKKSSKSELKKIQNIHDNVLAMIESINDSMNKKPEVW